MRSAEEKEWKCLLPSEAHEFKPLHMFATAKTILKEILQLRVSSNVVDSQVNDECTSRCNHVTHERPLRAATFC
eukprot:6477744-Amphidinium_carterae.1